MALVPCSECKKEISDKAAACPQCGVPITEPSSREARERRTVRLVVMVLGAVALAGVGAHFATRPSDYERVEALRVEQEEQGTRSDEVRQRYFRLYKEHPNDATYVYLWARCVEDPSEQLALAQQGMRADPRFSWNYNLAARDLARLGHVQEAYDMAQKGAALDAANLPLADKVQELKLMIDHHLDAQGKIAPSLYTTYDTKENFEKGAVRYEGLFHGSIRSPSGADIRAMERSRLQDRRGAASDAVQGFQLCTNHFADACVRVYVPEDTRFEPGWQHSGVDVTRIKENAFVKVAGSVVPNGRGENILLADTVTVEGTK